MLSRLVGVPEDGLLFVAILVEGLGFIQDYYIFVMPLLRVPPYIVCKIQCGLLWTSRPPGSGFCSLGL